VEALLGRLDSFAINIIFSSSSLLRDHGKPFLLRVWEVMLQCRSAHFSTGLDHCAAETMSSEMRKG
jgi:hypothetical protein